MFEYELQQLRSAELIRGADTTDWPARPSQPSCRQARGRRSGRDDAGRPASHPPRFARATERRGGGRRTGSAALSGAGPRTALRQGRSSRPRPVRHRGRARPEARGASRPEAVGSRSPGQARNNQCRGVGPLCDARRCGDQVRQSRVRRPRRRTDRAHRRARPRRRAASRRRCSRRRGRRRQDPARRGVRHRGLPPGRRRRRSAAASRSAPTACPSPPSPPRCAPCAAHLPDELAAAAAGQEDELARILPELGEHLARARHDEDGIARLFELTARLLERVAADRTVVVVLEDLHWADASTRHLLAYLFRTLRSGRLVVVATYRADDIHRRHPLRPLLAELDRLRTVRRIELARFNRAEVAPPDRRHPRDSEPDAALVDDIFERSDGNAFFVEELAVAAARGLPHRPHRLPARSAPRPRRGPARGRPAGRPDRRRGRLHRRVPAARRRRRALRGRPHRGAAGRRRRQHPARRPPTATATASGTPWSARPSATTCCPASAPASTAATPRPWRPTRRSSAPTSGPPAWPATGTTPTTPPRPCPPSSTPPSRPAAGTPTPSSCGCWNAPWSCGTTPPRTSAPTLRPVDYTEVYPPCGCDPATTPLRYLDLMAEAAVAARFGGDRERALTITKRALRLLEDDGRPPARRLVLDPALPARRRPGPRRRLGGTRHRPGAGPRAAAVRRARRRPGQRRQLGRCCTRPGPRRPRGRRTRRGVRAAWSAPATSS